MIFKFILSSAEGFFRSLVYPEQRRRILPLSICFFVLSFFGFSNAGQLVYSTFLGGGGGLGIAVDSAGNAYIAGITNTPDFQTTLGAFDTTYNGNLDVFVSKLNADGSALLYSTFIGGSYDDCLCYGIAVDSAGNAYITGWTVSSTDFPTTPGAFDTTYNGDTDVFVSKLNADGTALLYSTFLGGINADYSEDIAVDNAGNAYIAGWTRSTSNFPITSGAFDTTRPGNEDVFVCKLNSSGSALVYSTFLGGSNTDYARGIAVDTVGNAYITGDTNSSADFPITVGAFDSTWNGGGSDIFVSKINALGSALLYSTFLGGSRYENGEGIAVDNAGNAYIAGFNYSFDSFNDFPTTAGAFDTAYNGGYDVTVTKLNADGSALVYSTFFGGSTTDAAYRIAVDNFGNAYITGYTCSSDFPITAEAFDTTYNGDTDVFVSKLSANGTTLLYSTFLGGNNKEGGSDIAVNGGNIYITGGSYSSDFPTTAGAFDTDFNGTVDCFVSKINTVNIIGNVIYSDINKNSLVDQEDKLTLQFDRRMRVNGATASDFYLVVTTDNLGTGATVSINTANDTQVVITLGASPTLTITGAFSGNTTSGSPSGIDISATMTPNAIEDLDGLDAQDGGVPGVNDSGMDILATVLPAATYVPAYSSATIQVSTDTVNAYYTEHKLLIPSNSLSVSTTITAGPPGEIHGQLSAVSFSPPNLTFSSYTAATLVIEYKEADAKLEAGYMETAMRIQQWKDDSTGWVLIPETYGMQSVDMTKKTVSVKIDKFNMVGATGGSFKSFGETLFATNTMIVYANIVIPTVDATTTPVAPAPSGSPFAKASGDKFRSRNNKFLFSGNNATLSVGTAGIYTKHQLILNDYTTSYSGTTIILTQATLDELHNHPNYAVLKIVTYGEITTRAILAMEYKDHDDTTYNQFRNDVIGGNEPQMRIYRWRTDINQWEKVPGTQTVNEPEDKVNVVLDTLSISQFYAVKVDPSVTPVAVDYPWQLYDQVGRREKQEIP